MEESAGESASFRSVYEVALPFACQEQFTPIQSKVTGHPGIEFLKLYHEEKQTWVYMLNLEMTGLQSSYQTGAKVIPTRVFDTTKKRATGSVKPSPTTTEMSAFLSQLTSVFAAGNAPANSNTPECISRKRPCPTNGDGDVNGPTPPDDRDDADEDSPDDYNV
jgi:hypothetical protein